MCKYIHPILQKPYVPILIGLKVSAEKLPMKHFNKDPEWLKGFQIGFLSNYADKDSFSNLFASPKVYKEIQIIVVSILDTIRKGRVLYY